MSKTPFQVKALFEYSSPHEDDLSFPNGQLITVTDVEDDDWYYGEFGDAAGNKKEGLFPKNFVKLFEPETPPRPSRSSRTKKDLVQDQLPAASGEAKTSKESTETMIQPPQIPTGTVPNITPIANEEVPSPEGIGGHGEVEPAISPPSRRSTFEQVPTDSAPPPIPLAAKSVKAAPPVTSKPAPPPPAEKPASGSFRDRINAFNKSAAPPLAPVKPSGLGSSTGSGFIKKPFVAPPPSKNAYVPPPQAPPPPKVYRREEDPDIAPPGRTEAVSDDLPVTAPPLAATDAEQEDQPKPTSLKDRIALLQKQQMEQAARHAEKKEKAKKPKRHEGDEPSYDQEDAGAESLERVGSGEITGKKSMDSAQETSLGSSRTINKPRKSQDNVPEGGSAVFPPRELLSDTNDADQSGAGDTEEGDEMSADREDSDDKPHKDISGLHQEIPKATKESLDSNEKGEVEEELAEEEEEEEEIDPEVKRKMELRERMAKMSGGMGMAGMFGVPGALPPRAPMKQTSNSSSKRVAGDGVSTQESASRAPPVPPVPMPGLARINSPESTIGPPLQSPLSRDEPSQATTHAQELEADEDSNESEPEPPIAPSRRSTDRAPPPPPPQTRPVPSAPGQARAPPPLPSDRPAPPAPPAPSNSHPLPPTPAPPMSPSEGSESDDELDPHTKVRGLQQAIADDSDGATAGELSTPPTTAPTAHAPPFLPHRPKAPEAQSSGGGTELVSSLKQETLSSPKEEGSATKRNSRIPPIPGSNPSMPSASQSRAPPPPPPNSAPAPPSRTSTSTSRLPPPIPQNPRLEGGDEEITEYDGDYDTDMASSTPHKDALKAHARTSSLEDDSMAEEASLHHSGLPSIGPIPASAPRAAPPPPPNQPPRQNRASSDMPRAAPLPPPPPPPVNEADADEEREGYDPYNYNSGSSYRVPSTSSLAHTNSVSKVQEPEILYSPPPPLPPQRNVPPPQPPITQEGYGSSSSGIPTSSRSAPRQSSDIQRTSTSVRRSTDGGRQSGEQGSIAADVDLSPGSRWWTQPEAPPPVFQNRRDILFETEETSTTRRGGKNAITRTVYVLFMDYSQTIVTAHFESRDPTVATLEQRHESPPRSLRQDQLEEAYTRFGSQIAERANAIKENAVGDGSPHSLPLELISHMPDALLPIGIRAYGALVYANLANASVQQFDEIRPGDIVTFRNARFQGHRGPMHSKYTTEAGKPDHVGIVLEWDGTKKKVRVWEQGRESKKLKPESYKLGDMRSGEVKVWRVMARSWVGWEGQN